MDAGMARAGSNPNIDTEPHRYQAILPIPHPSILGNKSESIEPVDYIHDNPLQP